MASHVPHNSYQQSDDIAHLQSLMDIYTERLRVRQLQTAKLGTESPPHLYLEINELATIIERLQEQISSDAAILSRTVAEKLSELESSSIEGEDATRVISLQVRFEFRIFGVPLFSIIRIISRLNG
jgi:uncharacterized coiled-coil protein SlyX